MLIGVGVERVNWRYVAGSHEQERLVNMQKIHVLVLGATLCLLASGFPASAQELTKEAKVERILALTKADANIDRMMNQAKTMAASQMPPGGTPEQRAKAEQLQDRMIELAKDLIVKMRPQQIRIWSDVLSDEEINGLLAFYESPVGRAWVEKTPLIMSQMAIAMAGPMKEFQSEIQRAIKEALQ
jgi:hypothetical protein